FLPVWPWRPGGARTGAMRQAGSWPREGVAGWQAGRQGRRRGRSFQRFLRRGCLPRPSHGGRPVGSPGPRRDTHSPPPRHQRGTPPQGDPPRGGGGFGAGGPPGDGRVKTGVVVSPFALFGGGGGAAGGALRAEERRGVLADNRRETVPTRAAAYTPHVRVRQL